MSYVNTALKKPCIALMGEFSAGKSTLANLLIGSQPLPVQVVASHVPPVMISYGSEAPYRVDLAGAEHPIDLAHIAAAPLEETAYIRIFFEEEVLEYCDLLDMPGISDPNMSSEVWQRMISRADGVLWCSHATQAWRQSEAAVWASLPESLHQSSLLLLTRIDKIVSEKDRAKLVRRVGSETDGLFRACLPISLLQAASEQNDYDAWLRTGAGDFAQEFKALLNDLRPGHSVAESDAEQDMAEATSESAPLILDASPAESAPQRVMPRRIRAKSAITPRPL